jgi:phosphate-selective porin OprO/OprP
MRRAILCLLLAGLSPAIGICQSSESQQSSLPVEVILHPASLSPPAGASEIKELRAEVAHLRDEVKRLSAAASPKPDSTPPSAAEETPVQGMTGSPPLLPVSSPRPRRISVYDLPDIVLPENDPAMPPSVSEPEKRSVPLDASWENGLQLKSADDRFQLHVGGTGMIDTVWLIGPQSVFTVPGGGSNGVGNAEATFLRRAILQADGTIFGQFDYMLQFDFANASNDNSGQQPPSFGNLTSSPAPLNIWMQVRDVPYLGNVRVGNQDKPIGMTNNTSAVFLPFLERPDNYDAFYGPFDNGFALGVSANNWTESERVTWRYGIFQPATNVFGVALNKVYTGARITALPWYEEDGERLIHLGLGFTGGEIVQNELRVRARPLLRNAPGFAVPVLVDTGEIPGSRRYTIGPEFAMVLGSLTLQAEFAAQFLTDAIAPNGQSQGTVFDHGGYVEALYFLTGEHQDYIKREGVFGRVIPRNDYHWNKTDHFQGCGAWQIGIRFSYLDLNDKAIQGGQIYDWTAGLNWYLNPNMKVQLNYIAEHRDMPGVPVGWINGFGLRAAYDF